MKSTSENRQRDVGIWIRVSTEDQARGESPENHEKRARSYAENQGWIVKEVYHLEGVSGKAVSGHPETKRMLADIRRGHISGLMFSKLARLARNTVELLKFADDFKAAGADLISLQEAIDTSTPSGRLFFTMIAAMAQWEREEIVDRIKASVKIRAQLGKPLGGPAPFGYAWREKRLVVDPQEAPIRRRMYELYAEEKRVKRVVRLLNDAGYRTRNGLEFTDTTVKRLIQDMTAKGTYRAHHTYNDSTGRRKLKAKGEWVEIPVEPIVSLELWEQCNALLAERTSGKKPRARKPVHLFSGLLYCQCGPKMYVLTASPKYVCPKCRNKIPIEDLEAIFQEQLRGFVVSKPEIESKLAEADSALQELEARLEAHGQQLKRVQGEMKRVYDLYIAEQVSVEGFGKLYRPLEDQERKLSDEYPRLQGELDALRTNRTSADDLLQEALTLHESWPTLALDHKRSVMESITEKIVVGKDSVDISLCAVPTYVSSLPDLVKRQRNL